MKTSIITTAAAVAGAAFLISASLVSASIEPTASIQALHSNTVAKGDRLPVATTVTGNKTLVVAYRTGPGASTAVLF